MGWKSTIDLTREEAIGILKEEMNDPEKFNNETLADLVEVIYGGENHGHNYLIITKE